MLKSFARSRSSLALGLLLIGAGCARPVVEPKPGGGVTVTSARIGWYTKKVMTKREPETLLAEDGTICRVSPDRFRATKSGSAVLCNWQ